MSSSASATNPANATKSSGKPADTRCWSLAASVVLQEGDLPEEGDAQVFGRRCFGGGDPDAAALVRRPRPWAQGKAGDDALGQAGSHGWLSSHSLTNTFFYEIWPFLPLTFPRAAERHLEGGELRVRSIESYSTSRGTNERVTPHRDAARITPPPLTFVGCPLRLLSGAKF